MAILHGRMVADLVFLQKHEASMGLIAGAGEALYFPLFFLLLCSKIGLDGNA